MKRQTLLDILILTAILLSTTLAVAALGTWVEQAFFYSAALGRTEPNALATVAVSSCRVDAASQIVCTGFGAAIIGSILRLYFKRKPNLLRSAVRAFVELVAIGILAWLIAASPMFESVRLAIAHLTIERCA